MSSPTRFPRGVTNVAPTSALSQYGLPDPSKWHTYFTDFDTFDAANWDTTGVSFVNSLIDEDGGVLRTQTTGATGSYTNLLLGEGFLPEEGKKLIYKTRIRINDVLNSLLFVGLIQINSLNQSAYFYVNDASTELNFAVQNGASQPQLLNIGTLENDTYYDLGFVYDGESSFDVYIDDVLVERMTDFVLPNSEITPLISNSTDGTVNTDTDYIFVAKER